MLFFCLAYFRARPLSRTRTYFVWMGSVYRSWFWTRGVDGGRRLLAPALPAAKISRKAWRPSANDESALCRRDEEQRCTG